jgi:hypothetical protein
MSVMKQQIFINIKEYQTVNHKPPGFENCHL